jgi:triosephosphate isomerase
MSSASSNRGILIAGNWKMNYGPREAASFFQALVAGSKVLEPSNGMQLLRSGKLQACVIPPTLTLESAKHLAEKAPFPLTVAAQNAHWEKKGAFTGEISGPMLKEMGVEWVLIGHSERRQFFGETDETVRKRSESLLEQGFKVIVCIGETRAEREAGKTSEVLIRQMTGVCPEAGKGVAACLATGSVVFAYEPVWAIGTGLTASPEQAEEAHALIRSLLRKNFGEEAAARTLLLYGGSVTPENIDGLLACPNVDGGLVGGASLKPESFLALVAAGARKLSK